MESVPYFLKVNLFEPRQDADLTHEILHLLPINWRRKWCGSVLERGLVPSQERAAVGEKRERAIERLEHVHLFMMGLKLNYLNIFPEYNGIMGYFNKILSSSDLLTLI
jgi:hypothetical protein